MGNNNKKNATRHNSEKKKNTVCASSSGISSADLKDAIVSALREYEQEKNNISPEGINRTGGSKNGFLHTLIIVMSMPFARKKTIKGSETVKLLTSSLLGTVFNCLRIAGLFITVMALAAIGVLFATESKTLAFTFKVCFLVMTVFVSYLFAGLFRRVSVEVENISDESLLIAFFAAVGTWISIIIAAVALLK